MRTTTKREAVLMVVMLGGICAALAGLFLAIEGEHPFLAWVLGVCAGLFFSPLLRSPKTPRDQGRPDGDRQ